MIPDGLVEQIRDNLAVVETRMQSAARKAGRDPGLVRLVVVTKAQPIPVVWAAILAGAGILGENYAREALEKRAALKDLPAVEWHMIGHVQSRKSQMVAGNFDMLHSLDSLHLARRLEQDLAEKNLSMPVLLQFNIGGEASKSGWQAQDEGSWPGLLADIRQVLACSHLNVRGVMSMPPYFDHPESSRPYFLSTRLLRDFLAAHLPGASWQELSMGTSSDFSIAIEEGATLVRVGQAILGKRPNSQAVAVK